MMLCSETVLDKLPKTILATMYVADEYKTPKQLSTASRILLKMEKKIYRKSSY